MGTPHLEGPPLPPSPPVDPLKELKKQWQQTKAVANGMIRSGKIAEGVKILKDFLKECERAKANDLIAEVKAEIAKVK